MLSSSLVEALTEARRKAKMSGRPLSEQEVKGVSGAYFTERNREAAQQKSLQLQEKGQKITEKLGSRSLQLAKLRFEAEKEAADAARKRDQRAKVLGLAGAGIGLATGAGPEGALIGMSIGQTLATGYL